MKQIKRYSPKHNIVYAIMVGASVALLGGGLLWWTNRSPSLPQTTYRAGQIPVGGKTLTYLAGPSSAQSDAFIAPPSWDIYWDFLCNESAAPGYFSVTVFDKDGTKSTQARPITAKGISGFGDQKYTMSHSETFTLRVESNCNWHLTAQSAKL